MRELPAAYACHCGECKKQTASAFSMSLVLDYADLAIVGAPATLETRSFSGKRKIAYFCDRCGTRLWHSATNPPTAITLKVGTLDEAQTVRPVAHLWVSKKNPGLTLDPSAEAYDTQPDDVGQWRKRLLRD